MVSLGRPNSRVWYGGPTLEDSYDYFISTVNMYCPTFVTIDDDTITIDTTCRLLSYDENGLVTIDSTFTSIDSNYPTLDEE